MKDLIYNKFVTGLFDEDGMLSELKWHYPDNFNFAYDVVDELARKHGDNKTAMIWVSKDGEERRYTFESLRREVNRTANYFKSIGIKKGDRVMLILKRHYHFWYSILALHKIGAIAVPATNQLLKKDLVYRFNAAGISAVVSTPYDNVPEEIDKSIAESPTLKTRVIVGQPRDGWHYFDEEYSVFDTEFPRDESLRVDDIMLMYFSSGTTGYPKIVAHMHTYALGHIVTGRWWHMVEEEGVHLTISDTGWGKAVWGKLYGQWLAESCVFVYDFDRFHPEKILPMFAKYNITTFCAPPTIFRFLIKEDLSKYDLSSLKYSTIAGEALNPEVFKQWYQATGLKLMEGFGQTETTLTVANLVGMEPKPGSMGRPNPQYKICLLDGADNPVQDGEEGEICIDTHDGAPVGLFKGYYNDPKKTAEAWHDGYYHTGDMAWRDEDGYYWYVGRTDDLIKSSGYRIGPFEIESVLMELPYVLECAVTGTPDPVRGQVVKATIILTKGTEGTDALKKDIQDYVKHHTAPYKYPRVIEFVDTLPKTASGKIIRKAIH